MPYNYTNSYKEFEKAKSLIPGAVQASRKPYIEENYPVYIERGQGSHVWDIDGNEYIDYIMGMGPVILGHAHPEVTEAVIERIRDGNQLPMSSSLQNKLAQMLIDIIPCAEMVYFLKTGSAATSAAVRIARAYTGKEIVLRCGYHGWMDWCYGDYFGKGIPVAVQKLVAEFKYNDLDSVRELIKRYDDNAACIIITLYDLPEGGGRNKEAIPDIGHLKEGFLEGLRKIANEHSIVLVFDEVRTGFRFALGGAQEYFGVTPDLATFSKGIANGFPLSAVAGKREIMEKAKETHLSATFNPELSGIVAAMKTIEILRRPGSLEHIWSLGKRLMEGLDKIGKEVGLDAHSVGLPPIPHFVIKHEDEGIWRKLRTTFYSQTTANGILFHPDHHWFISLSHTKEDIDKALEVSRDALKKAKKEAMK